MYKIFSQDDTPGDSIAYKEITKESLGAIVQAALRVRGITDQELVDRSVNDAMTKLSRENPGYITFKEFDMEAERNPHILEWLKIDVERVISIVCDE